MPLFGEVAVGLNAEMHLEQTEQLQPVNLVVVLDRSGSMAGSRIAAAKQAICAFYKGVLAQKLLSSNTLLAFDTHCETFSFAGQDQPAIEQTVNSIKAGGGTNFRDALSAVQAQVETSSEGSAFFVAFFSDGQDTSGLGRGYYGGYGSDVNHAALLQQVRLC